MKLNCGATRGAHAAQAPALRERHHYSMFNVDELVKSPFYMDLGI
jgi:hypothetical protein